jgi:aminomethyltransferase
MRRLPFRETYAAKNARFTERYGIEIPECVSDKKTEYEIVRNAAGVSDFSFMQKFRVPEETGLDFLDDLFAGNVARIRFGRVLHTFLADENGMLVADCYIANDDENFIVLCESIVDDARLKEILDANGAQDAGLEDLTPSHAVINIDGYKAWAVARELFASDVLGLPYLSVETYQFEGADIKLIRGGKTSEFGYSFLAPIEIAPALFDRVVQSAEKNDGGMIGMAIHNDLRLEGRFFNIYNEGVQVKDPLPLGLQWMIDFDKERFNGRDAIMARRAEGQERKIVGVRMAPSKGELSAGARIFDDDADIGAVIGSCYSYTLDAHIGLALLSFPVAYAGLTYHLDAPDGPELETISMPPIMPKSLTVKLDEI